MADYREIYLTMMRATEQAIQILIAAQQKCEELYLSIPEPELHIVESPEQIALTEKGDSDIMEQAQNALTQE